MLVAVRATARGGPDGNRFKHTVTS